MRIAILDDYQNVSRHYGNWDKLADSHEITVFNRPLADPATDLQPFQIICAMRERTMFDRTLVESLPELKLIVTTGMKNAAIDGEACADNDIVVCGTNSPGHATAELAFALILAQARQILPESASLRAGNWQQQIGRDIRGATLGIIGLGRLGAQMAGFAKALGMEVLAWSQNLTEERCAEIGVEYAEKSDLLARADFVTIHLRFSERTEALIGADELKAMKPAAFLVNTSRGPIIQQDALIAALKAGTIAGAALDVYDREPLPRDHPLLEAPNLLLTPHLGYVTGETYSIFYRETVEAVEAFIAGDPVRVITP